MVHGQAYLRRAGRRQGAGRLPGAPTVGKWLAEWLAGKKALRAATVRSYESHIRLYFVPCIGHIRLDRLQVADVASVFGYIDGLNDAVAAARASGFSVRWQRGRAAGRIPRLGTPKRPAC